MTQKIHDITSALNEFRSELNASVGDIQAMTHARAETRNFLRGQFIPQLRFLAKSERGLDLPQDTHIRFLTQGSFAYRTLNSPVHTPPQHMDLDDGVYFRMSDVEWITPGKLLQVMETVLGEWAQRKGWRQVRKSNCCRVVLPATNGSVENKHIDWPVYAIRDDQMGILEKGAHELRYAATYQEWQIPYHSFAAEVLLAHKEKWVNSDPRKVIDWVADMKRKHSTAFINVCRYLKAWRDYQWHDSPLTSIAIMAIVAHAFEQEAQPDDKEDDLLFRAVKHIVPCLMAGVVASFDSSERLDKNIGEQERADIQNKARIFLSVLRRCLYDNISPLDICRLMQEQFGDRFPSKGSLIHACSVVPAAIIASPVKAIPPYAGEHD